MEALDKLSEKELHIVVDRVINLDKLKNAEERFDEGLEVGPTDEESNFGDNMQNETNESGYIQDDLLSKVSK